MAFLVFLFVMAFIWLALGVSPGVPGFVIAVLAAMGFGIFSRIVRALSRSSDGPIDGEVIGQTCPDAHCRRVNEPQARFCAQCGQRLK